MGILMLMIYTAGKMYFIKACLHNSVSLNNFFKDFFTACRDWAKRTENQGPESGYILRGQIFSMGDI